MTLALAVFGCSRGSCGHPKLADGENLHPALGRPLSYEHHRNQLLEDKHKHKCKWQPYCQGKQRE